MKKLIFVLLLFLGILGLCSCSHKEEDMTPLQQDNGAFVLASMQNISSNAGNTHIYVVYDKNTKIQYVIVCKYQGGASIIVMVDENGNPLLYED